MVKIKRSLLTFLILMISSTLAEEEGDSCIFQRTWTLGACKKLGECRIAILAFKAGIRPQICTFAGTVPVVCCIGNVILSPSNPAPPKPAPTTRATTTPKNSGRSNTSDECPPVPAMALKITKNGQKARDYCIDLINTIFRCRPSLNGNSNEREELCPHDGRSVSTSLEPAGMNEFPHMALLGYGDALETAKWICGGTLINERWVMTAARCTFIRSAGSEVKFIRLGTPEVDAQLDRTKLFDVMRIVDHPNWALGVLQQYNDIALIQLDRDATFGPSVIPACLHTDPAVTNKAVITGWGSHHWQNKISKKVDRNVLQKVTLEEFSRAECSQTYPSNFNLSRDVINETQICYGIRQESKSFCWGDSGSPIQIQNEDVFCTYTIIGILSYGIGCGIPGSPDIYTRVAAYISWIESVAWPEIL